MGGGFIRLRLFMFQYALFVLQSIETPRCCRGDTEALLGHEVSRQSIEPAYTLRAGASAHYRETTGRGRYATRSSPQQGCRIVSPHQSLYRQVVTQEQIEIVRRHGIRTHDWKGKWSCDADAALQLCLLCQGRGRHRRDR